MSPETAGGVTGVTGAASEGGAGAGGATAGGGATGTGLGGGGLTAGLAQAATRARSTSERWRQRIAGSLTGVESGLNQNPSARH